MRYVMCVLLLLGCPAEEAPSDGQSTETSTGGEGETTVIVEQIDEGEEPIAMNEGSSEMGETGEATECTTSDDCPEGQMCAGEEGCDVTWTCQAPRPCTRDLQTYCSCAGETVQGSGSCPPQPWAHRGACEG